MSVLRHHHDGIRTQSGSIDIDAPPEAVWELITTVASICEWYDTWDVVEPDSAGDGRLRVGTSFRLARHRPGHDDAARCVVTELTAPTRLRWEQSAARTPVTSVTFHLWPGADDTTQLRHTRTWSER